MSQAPRCKHGEPERGVHCKKCKLPELTYSEWMDAMQVTESVPKCWKRRGEIEKEVGLKKDAVLCWMRNNPGKWERQDFRIKINGTPRLTPHYRLKANEKK